MTTRQKVIELLVQECSELEERYDGYRKDAAVAIRDIVQLEAQAAATSDRALGKVSDRLAVLGDKLNVKTSDGSGEVE